MGTIIKMKYHNFGAMDNTDLSLEEKALSEIIQGYSYIPPELPNSTAQQPR